MRIRIGPLGGIDGEAALDEQGFGSHALALCGREDMIRHRDEPDVGIEADLVAGVAGRHRPAARLRHVADQDPGPARVLVRLGRQPLHQRDHVGVGEITAA